MRQPANLRGATLPGLSQPSEKEGPHHRSYWLLRLQRSLSFRLVVEGGYLRLWKTTKNCSPFGQKGSPSCMRAGSVTCSQWGFAFLHVFLCVWLLSWFWWFTKLTHSVWKMVATESEAWHANGQGSMIACSSVGRLNHSTREPGRRSVTRGKIPKVYNHFLSSCALHWDDLINIS